MHWKLENINKVFDGLTPHNLLLLGEYVEEELENLLLWWSLANYEHDLRQVDKSQAYHLRYGLENVLAQLLVLHIFEHPAEHRVNFLCRFIFYLTIVEVLNVIDLHG